MIIKSNRMIRILFILLLSASAIKAQGITNLLEIESDTSKNVFVQKLYSDSLSSSFYIEIKESVPLHFHEYHSETVYIISGKAQMTMNNDTLTVKEGDLIDIPFGTKHAVLSVIKGPLKVLSVQAPEFLGKDRVFIKEE